MKQKSFYRKYRPNSFAEIVSQNETIHILQNSIFKNSFNHAYLFSGSKGTGKTSTAKIFAKAINCQKNINGDVCNKCQNCLEINNNNCLDILEIDGASNNGVDEIRKIKENINLLPMNFKYKVYIIDEVHMLTTPAFNALLKTLEEPPQHAIFILATTEPYKVLPTIVSRCQWFEFKKISSEDLKQQFIKVLTAEKIKFELAALHELAFLSDGSLRDGLNYCEKVFNYSNNITLKSVEKTFSVLSTLHKIQFLVNIFNCDMPQIMTQLELFDEYAIQYHRFIIDFIYIIEDILVYRLTSVKTVLKILNYEQVMIFQEITSNDLSLVLNNFNEVLMQNYLHDLKPILLLKIIKLINMFNNKYVVKYDHINVNDNKGQNVASDNETRNNQKTSKSKEKTTKSIVKTSKTENINKKVTVPSDNIEPLKTDNENVVVNGETVAVKTSKQELISNEAIKPLINNKNVNISAKKDDLLVPATSILSVTKDENSAIIKKVINLVLQADKNMRQEINAKWRKINDFITENKFRNITKIYLNTVVTAATHNAFIIVSENITQSKLINQKFLTKEHRDFLIMLLGQEYMIYALDKKQWQETRKEYQKLVATKTLPLPQPIIIPTVIVDDGSNGDKDPTLALMQKLFVEVEEI